MSRAFIKEDAGDDELPERPLPSGPNYVTPRGLELLRAAVQSFPGPRADLSKEQLRDLRYWEARLGGAIVVDNSKKPPPDVRFGARIEARGSDGKSHAFRIVGQDEAKEGGEKIAWDSTLSRDFLGRKAGERVAWTRDGGDVELELHSVSYPA